MFKTSVLILSFFIMTHLISQKARAADYEKSVSLLPPQAGFQISNSGAVQVDEKKWQQQKESNGTEIFSYQRTSADPLELEDKTVVIHDGHELKSVASYALGAKAHLGEVSSSIEFANGQMVSVTQCEDKVKPGRSCLTVNSALCLALKKNGALSDDLIQKLQRAEIHALALILTLRGESHQLENVASTGNRFGIRSPAQTTKGQLGLKDARQTLSHLCERSGFTQSPTKVDTAATSAQSEGN